MGRGVCIVGGGLVGLGSATMFAKAGWEVKVYERADALREIGAAIGVKPGAASVLERLGLLREIASEVVLTSEQRRDGAGNILQERRLQGEECFYNPLRQELLDVLSRSAQSSGVEIFTGVQVTGATRDGTIHFADGRSEHSDLVVGADGFHSAIRETMGLGRVKRSLPSGATRVVFPRSGEEDARVEFWAGRLRIGLAPASRRLMYAYLSCPESDLRARQVPIDVEYWSSAFPGIRRDIFVRMNEAGGVRHRYSYVRCSSWTRGRVALVGDAAHALPATLGIGASMGMVNAYYLVEAAQQRDVVDGLKQWDIARRPASQRTQWLSLMYDLTARRTPTPLLPMRNKLMRMLNKSSINKRLLGLNVIRVQ